MNLHFEEENLSKKQECSALTSNLEGTSLNCVMVKRANKRDSAGKIFDIRGYVGLPEGERSQVGLQASASAAHDRRSKANESGWTLH